MCFKLLEFFEREDEKKCLFTFDIFIYFYFWKQETKGMLTPTEDYNSEHFNFLQPRAGE